MRYDWKIGPAEVHNVGTLADVVHHIMWYCTAYAPDGTTYKKSGSVPLGSPSASSFVPFANLTQNQVQAWVFTAVNQSSVESQLAAEYANSVNGHMVKQFNF
jgi:hypothetical protein